jgi:hypothetical protein
MIDVSFPVRVRSWREFQAAAISAVVAVACHQILNDFEGSARAFDLPVKEVM